MRRRALLTFLLATTVALVGCIGSVPDDGADDGDDVPEAGQASSPEEATPREEESPTSGVEEGQPADAGTRAEPQVNRTEHTVPPTAGTPVYSWNGVDVAHLEPTDATSGYILEIAWEADGPESQELSLWVRPHNLPRPTGTPVDFLLDPPPTAKAEGPSPLRLALPVDDLPDEEGYSVFVRAAANPVGLTVDQPITAYVTTFHALPFDEGFSALA